MSCAIVACLRQVPKRVSQSLLVDMCKCPSWPRVAIGQRVKDERSAVTSTQRAASKSATDFDVVRRALGERKLPLYGHIYYERTKKAHHALRVFACVGF